MDNVVNMKTDYKNDKINALVSIHNEYRTTGRWQEQSRERSSSMIIAANSVIIGFIVNANFSIFTLAMCPIIYILSVLGQFFALKYFFLSERDYIRARFLRAKIDDLISEDEMIIKEAFEKAQKETENSIHEKSKLSSKGYLNAFRLHEMWHRLHSFFKLLSIIIAIFVIIKWSVANQSFLFIS